MVTCQVVLLSFMIIEQFTADDSLEALAEPSSSVTTVVARFICALIMHIMLTSETKQGLLMMKYATNHHWKFRNWQQAFMIGLCQTFVLITCEFVNLIILCTN